MPTPPTVQPIPTGFRTVTPHLVVHSAAEALAFYTRAFAGVERRRSPMPDGRIMHAEIQIGDSIVFVVDDFPEFCGGKSKHPRSLGGTPVSLHLYVDNCDAWTDRAAKAGCEVVMPPMDAFWGDRFAMVRDPFGHEWTIATHTRDLTPDQMCAEMKKSMGR